MSKFKLFQKQLDSVVKNTTNLRELQKLAVEVMVILENRMKIVHAGVKIHISIHT